MYIEDKELEYRVFDVVQSVSLSNLSRQKQYVSFSSIEKDVMKTLNRKAVMLFELLKREIDEHNSTIEAKITRVQNMKWSSNWQKSELIDTSNLSMIVKLLKDNPNIDRHDAIKQLNL